MIKENELRIGNRLLYHVNEDGIEWDVCTVDWHDIKWISQDPEGFNQKHKPIPLTEEWLLKFGFSKMTDTMPYNYRIHKSKMFFYIRYGTFTTDGGETDLIGFNGLFVGGKFVRVIKYIHELQNLYFVLIGEELKPINN